MFKSPSAFLTLSAFVLISSIYSHPINAQQLPFKGILGMEQGDYTWTQMDRTVLDKEYLTIMEARSKEDYEYFKGAVETFELTFRNFVLENVFDEPYGLKYLNRRALNAEYVPVAEFLVAKDNYAKAVILLNSRIQSLAAVTDLPSQKPVPGSVTDRDEIPNYGDLNFGPIREFYESRVRELGEFVGTLDMRVTLADGTFKTFKGLELPPEALRLPPERVRELNQEASTREKWNRHAREALDRFTNFVRVQLVQEFITTYGSEERYRPRGAADFDNQNDMYERIAEAFWLRSYIRINTGMPIGAIGITWDKKYAKLDLWTTPTSGILTFIQAPVWEQGPLDRAKEAYQEALRTAGERSAEVFGGDLGLLAGINSAMTFVGGYRTFAQTIHAMALLLANDLREELVLTSSRSGLSEIYADYVRIHGSDPQNKAKVKQWAEEWDFAKYSEGDDEDIFAGGGVGSTNTLNGQYVNLMPYFEEQEQRLDQAREFRAEARAGKGGDTSGSESKRRKRADRLNDF